MALLQDLQRLKHLIASRQQQKLVAAQAKSMLPFLEKMHKRDDLHSRKKLHLEIAMRCLKEIEKNNDAPKQFEQLIQSLDHYSLLPSLYLLRHPDKSKIPGRSLSEKGVLQAKMIGEHVRDEILLSPKPVIVRIFTSEIARTNMFGKIIEHINEATRSGLPVVIDGPRQHPAMRFGPLADEMMQQWMKLLETKSEFDTVQMWREKQSPFKEQIAKGNISDPQELERDIAAFVKEMIAEAERDIAHYTIIIGIGHSGNLDMYLYPRTGVRKIIATAEFAKVECNELFYDTRWHRL